MALVTYADLFAALSDSAVPPTNLGSVHVLRKLLVRDTATETTALQAHAKVCGELGKPSLTCVYQGRLPGILEHRVGLLAAADLASNTVLSMRLVAKPTGLEIPPTDNSVLWFWQLPEDSRAARVLPTGDLILAPRRGQFVVYNPFDGFVEVFTRALRAQRVFVGPYKFEGAGEGKFLGRAIASPGNYMIEAHHDRDGVWQESSIRGLGDTSTARLIGVEDGDDGDFNDTIIRFFSMYSVD